MESKNNISRIDSNNGGQRYAFGESGTSGDGEIWRPIPDFEFGYEASSIGRIRSIDRIDSAGQNRKGRVLSQGYTLDGYCTSVLCKNGKMNPRRVHRLVMEAFIGKKDGLEVNHKNGVKSDNRLSNLEYTTRVENRRHASRTGLNVMHSGEKAIRAKINNKQARIIRSCRGEVTQRELAKIFGVTQPAIGYIMRGEHFPNT